MDHAPGVAQMRRERQCDCAGLLIVDVGDRQAEEVNEEIPAELRLRGIDGAARRRDRVGGHAWVCGGRDQVNLGLRFSRKERTPSA